MFPLFAFAFALSSIGKLISGASAKSQADSQADDARKMARYEDMAAVDSIRQGQFEAGRVSMKGGQEIGVMRAEAAASGLDPSSGFFADQQAQQRMFSTLDEFTVINNAARQAWGHEQQATMYRSQAKQLHRAGNVALATSLLDVGASAVQFGFQAKDMLGGGNNSVAQGLAVAGSNAAPKTNDMAALWEGYSERDAKSKAYADATDWLHPSSGRKPIVSRGY